MRERVPEGLESGLRVQGKGGLSIHAHLPRKEVQIGFQLDWTRDAQHVEGGLVLEILRGRPARDRVTAGRACFKKGHMPSQICRWLDQAQEQPRPGQTGTYGTRCGTLLGLTARGRHPSRHGQLRRSTTGKAATEAQACGLS